MFKVARGSRYLLLAATAIFVLISCNPASASVYAYYIGNSSANVQSPSVTLGAGTAGSSSVSTTLVYATASVTASLTFYEDANMPTSCSSPTADTTLTAPPSGTTGSFTLSAGQTGCLWSPAYTPSTSLYAGSSALSIWASTSTTPTLALDGSGSGTGTSVSKITTATFSTSHTNDIIFVSVSISGTQTIAASSVTGSPTALTFTARSSEPDGASGEVVTFYAIATGTLTTESISVALSPAASGAVVAFGISGANTASPFDPHSGIPAKTTGLSPSVSITTTNPNDFLIGSIYCLGTAPTYTAGTGLTIIRTGTSGGDGGGDDYRVVTSAGTYAVAFTTAGTVTSCALLADAVTGTATLTVNAYTTTSTGVHNTQILTNGVTGFITSTKADIQNSFSTSLGTVPAGGYIEVTVTATVSTTIYWGYGQQTTFQTPAVYNYILSVYNPTSASWSVNLATMASLVTNYNNRLTNLTILFTSPSYSQQIIVISSGLTRPVGSKVLLGSSGTLYIAVGAYADLMPATTLSTVTFSVEVWSTSTACTQYVVALSVG